MNFLWLLNIFFLLLIFIILSIFILFIERKFIAIAQRRIGITFLGRNGWLHLPADIIKFWLKFSNRNVSIWQNIFSNSFILAVSFFFWNLFSCLFFTNTNEFSISDSVFYQLFIYFCYANVTTIYLFFLTFSMYSKYSVIGSFRLLLVSISLEFSFLFSFIYLIFFFNGFSFDSFNNNTSYLFIFLFPILSLVIFLYILFESKRAPFDHAEAESELIAGHITEFGGKTLLLFYFSEYTHLLFCIFLIKVVCLNLNLEFFILLNNFLFLTFKFQETSTLIIL